MARLWLTVSMPLVLLLALSLAAIHSQPANATDAQAFFDTVEPCDQPCFLGIQPGVSSAGGALVLLGASDWVGAIQDVDNALTWTWSGQQPSLIDATAVGRLILDDHGRVAAVFVQTVIPLQRIWLQLGIPQKGYALYQSDAMLNFNVYDALGMTLLANTPCPADTIAFLSTPVLLYWGDGSAFPYSDADYSRSWRAYAQCA